MDKEGNIWVAAGGLWCFNVSLQEWTLFENSKEDNYSIPAGTVIQVAFDRQLNGIWALAGQRFAFTISGKEILFNPGAYSAIQTV